MNEKDLLRLEFDLYSRHHIITQAVRALADGKALHLLDAGGRSGLVQSFMPEQELSVVDIRQPETESDQQLKKRNKYFIGSVLDLPLPDRSVDLALSLEMLEHMEAKDRPKALAEMLRVSRMGIIFSFPQDSQENDQAERLVNSYYKRLTGKDHPWLKEHIQQRPLPQPQQLEGVLRDLGLEFVCLSSSNTYLWTLMRYYIFSAQGFQTDLEGTFEFYNKQIAKTADAIGPSYRSIYVAVRPEFAAQLAKLPKQASGQSAMPPAVLELLDKVFDSLTTQIERKTQHIVNLEATIQMNTPQIQTLEELLQKKDVHIRNIEEQVKVANQQREQIEVSLQHKDVHIQNIESFQRTQQDLILNLQEVTKTKESHIQKVESALGSLKEDLEQERSVVLSQRQRISDLRDEMDKFVLDTEDKLEAKETQVMSLLEQVKLQEQVVQNLDQTIQAKDTHIRNIQPSFDEMQSFRKYFLMRGVFTFAHGVGKSTLQVQKRAQHVLVALHIWRTQGFKEVLKSLKRYSQGTNVTQSPLQFNAMPLNEQYRVLRAAQPLTKDDLRNQKEEVQTWSIQPLISIVIAAYFVEAKWLEKCVDSVRRQTYSRLEVVVVVHPDLDHRSLAILKKISKKDKRLRLVTPGQMRGATQLWNAGLQACKGEFVIGVTGDDELPPEAVYYLVKSIQTDQKIDLVYGDEDTIQTDDTPINPHFKSDFNLDLLLSTNYFDHAVMFRKTIAEKVGWLREEVDGAQWYDLWLRLVEKTHRIQHIPKVLYHQRISTNSLADGLEKRTLSDVVALRVLEEYAARNAIQATASLGLAPNTFRFQRKITQPGLVSIIIPFKDKVELLKVCVPSILNKTDYQNYEILLVSNNSTRKDTAKYVSELVVLDKRIRSLQHNVPFNYSEINNWAVKQASGEYILLLNNDVEVISSEWLSAMVEHIQRPEVGAVGAQLLYPNHTIQHAGVVLGIGGAAGHSHKYFSSDLGGYFYRLSTIQNFSAVTGACLLTKKSLFEQVHGLNEKQLAISLNDVDYCLKLRAAGYLITYTPYAKLYHHESLSRGLEDSPEKQQRFAAEFAYFEHTWGTLLKHDPYYNPNLTLKAENFNLNVF